MIAVDGESLGLELACPHCAKTVPVPWEDIAVEEQGQAKAAAPAAAPSLIAQVEPARSYDFSRFHQLANALPELCAYTAVSKWNQVAKEEQNRIKEAFQTIDDALQQFVEAIAKLSLDLDRAKTDFEKAADQRRGIRCQKEAALAPLETTKAKLEHQLMNLEKHLLWIERFE